MVRGKRNLILIAFAMAALVAVSAGCGTKQAAPGGAQGQTGVTQGQPGAPQGQAAKTAGGPKTGGTLRFGARGDVDTLDPHVSTADVDRLAFHAVYDPLLNLNEKMEIIPWLASSWDVTDGGRTYTFHLQKGVKFHDGTPFNAEAVKFNFERILNPDTKSPLRADFSLVTKIEVVDELTLKVTLKEPFSPFLSVLVDRNGHMVSPTAVKKYGADYKRNPVGTGPFVFKEWVKDDRVTFERNPNYWQVGKPYLDSVVFKVVPDDAVRVAMLKTGEIDVMDWVAPKDAQGIKNDPNLQYLESAGLGFDMIRLNTQKPPFDNKALRQALSYAIDRDALLKVVYLGAGKAANGPILPSLWAYDPAVKGQYSDAEKAKEKLKEGGKPNGFSFTLQVRNVPQDSLRAQATQAQLAKHGITMNIQTVDANALMANLGKGDFEASQSYWSGRVDPDGNMFRHFHSSSFKSGNNYMGYSNPKVDELLAGARSETANDKRKAAYAQASQLIADDVPMVFTYWFVVTKGENKKVQGLPAYADNMIRFVNVWLNK